MRERTNDIAKAASNTCTWLSEDSRYLKWSNQRHGLLWIKGHPGVGKSTLMKHAAELERCHRTAIFASFFFYGGGTFIQKSTLGLFQSLLHQITQQVPSVLLELTSTYKKRCETDGEFGKIWTWHERELQDFFESTVVETAKTHTMRIFVDALDECDEQTATSLVSFFKGVADSLSICFSCRHHPPMALENGLEICVQDKNAQDIKTFVCHKLDGESYEPIRGQIIQKSAGNFQWVGLVVSLVLNLVKKGKPLMAIQRKIQDIPPKLRTLYEELLTSIPDEDIQETLRLMQWIYFGMRPLSLTELRFAMAVDANPSATTISQCQGTEHYVETDEAMERRVRDLSKGLAEPVRHEQHRVVQFIHQSVIDFLRDGGLQLLDRSQRGATADTLAGRSHFRLSNTCIRYPAMDEIQKHRQGGGHWLTAHPVNFCFRFLDYSATFWIEHAAKCEENSISAGQLLSYCHSSGSLDLFSEHCRGTHYKPMRPETVVHIASRYNIPRALNDILSQGAKADLKNGAGRTPLSLAAERGHETVARMLLERDDVSPDSVDKNGRTPLSWAAEKGHNAIGGMLIERRDVKADSKDDDYRSPLSRAAANGHEAFMRMLLKRDDVSPDSVDKNGRTPLSWAAEKGHNAIGGMLIERRDVKADSKDDDYRSPLSRAAANGHEAFMRMLLKRDDVSPDSVDKNGRTPLSWAAEKGHNAIGGMLIERRDVKADSKDDEHRSPLTWAASRGNEAIVRMLLERDDIEVNSSTFGGVTPLSVAAASNHEKIVRLLLKRGDVNANPKGRTAPVNDAARAGHEGVVRLLLKRDEVEADSTDLNGLTPLNNAIHCRHEGIVRLLLERGGVDANLKDSWLRTPLWYAIDNGHEGILSLLLGRDEVEVNFRDSWKKTPLRYAIQKGHEGIIRLLLERRDVEVNSKNPWGKMPLYHAIKDGNEGVVKVLLERDDIDVNLPDSCERTPLSFAAGFGHEGIVRLLLERDDVDANLKNMKGRTPLWYATEKGHERIVRLLEQRTS